MSRTTISLAPFESASSASRRASASESTLPLPLIA